VPVPNSTSREVQRGGRNKERGLESENTGSDGATEFDQIWSQTVEGAPPSRPEAEAEPASKDPLSEEGEREVIDVPVAVPSPPIAQAQLVAGSPASLPTSMPAVENPADGLPEESPVSSGPVFFPDAGNAVGPEGRGQPLSSATAALRPGQPGVAPPPPSGLSGPVARPSKEGRGGSIPVQAEKIAGKELSPSAALIPPVGASKGEENFLLTDIQPPVVPEKRSGISAALPGTPMRRPSEKSSPSSMPSPIASRLSTGLSRESVVPVSTGLRSSGGGTSETDSHLAELSSNDRIMPGSAIPEGTSVSPTSSGSLHMSLPGLRSADAASVLEMVNRMADQMASRRQDNLSMTVRFEDGGSVRIRMISDKGEIRALFQTDLPGLESALRQQWLSFSQEVQDRGIRLNSMAFASTDASLERDDSPSRNHDQSETFSSDRASSSPTPVDGATPSGTPVKPRQPATATQRPGRLRAWV